MASKQREEALRLRIEEKLTFNEIAARLGVSSHTVQRWTKPDFAQRNRETSAAWKERNREANRARDRARSAHPGVRGTCIRCGGPMGRGRRKDGECMGCRVARKENKQRTIQSMWMDGETVAEIAIAIGTTVNVINTNIVRMRQAGWDLPYRRPRVAA